MARQPEVFVRALESAEAQRLVKITRMARDRVRLRRAGIVLASVQGRSAAEAAAMFAATPRYAREVIHAFNEQGFAALDPKWSGGRPRRFGPLVREIVCRVAKTPPQQLGRPFTTWSLSKLVEHQGEHHRIVICTTPSPSVALAGSSRFPTSAPAVQPDMALDVSDHLRDNQRARSVSATDVHGRGWSGELRKRPGELAPCVASPTRTTLKTTSGGLRPSSSQK